MTETVQYYVSGHTAEGYVNYLSKNLQGINHVIMLRHDDEPALTTVFQHIAATFEKRKKKVEIISGLAHADTVVGVIVRGEETAILASSIVPESIPGARIVDIGRYSTKSGRPDYSVQEEKTLETVYASFKRGLELHDQLENIYVQEMDFDKADDIAEEFIGKLLQNVDKKKRQPVVYERLFGTNTPDGKVNHVETLIAPLQNVYYVKGRAGTGKSVFMKKILKACKDYGYDIEMYRCSFDPNSVDMIIVRDLDFCIFDSTPPHEFFPYTDQGEIIDLYELTVTPGTDEHYKDEIRKWTEKYQAEMKKGMQELSSLKYMYKESHVNVDLESVLKEIYSQLNHLQI